MGLLSLIFGRTKLRKPNREQFFSVITAAESLSGRTDLIPAGKAGVVFSPVESTFFENLNTELTELLKVSGRATETRCEIKDDSYGTRWVVLEDQDFEDLVATIHLVAETIAEHGFGDRLLAAVLQLNYEGKNAYWLYNYKQGRFYPFVLSGPQQRDNAAELRLGTLMEGENIPVQKELEQWYAIWGIPF
jgi:hypothetical protein